MIIVCFGSEPWYGLWQRHHHLMSRLSAKGHKVVYVDPTNLLPSIKKPKIFLNRLERLGNNLIVVRPLFLPYHHRFITLEKIDGMITTGLINRALEMFGATEPDIFWSYTPYYNFLMNSWPGSSIIYDCVDACDGEFTKNRSNMDVKDWMREREALLLKEADAVLAVSKGLLERSASLNVNSYLVSNGTSFQSRERTVPKDLAAIRSPMIGYVGCLGDWVDYDLLLNLATSRPDYSIVLVGPITTNNETVQKLKELENVHLLGKRDYYQIPSFIEKFDVCLIPFTIELLTRMANPVKMFEYAALGKPIVSTPIDGVLEFSDLVYSSDGSSEDFVRKVDAALNEDDEGLRERRIAMARAHDWDSIVLNVEDILEGVSHFKHDADRPANDI